MNSAFAAESAHSRQPDEHYALSESCSPGPRSELFARGSGAGRTTRGDQTNTYSPDWPTHANHSQVDGSLPEL
ncbi:hypothetical protein [Accumulibacter sp.]|uniref:hypothetical protein n=1 Tax=Accumulibacter sp. TaxID=2053492 RepID=UPI0035B012EA